jgi:hypothetical protein
VSRLGRAGWRAWPRSSPLAGPQHVVLRCPLPWWLMPVLFFSVKICYSPSVIPILVSEAPSLAPGILLPVPPESAQAPASPGIPVPPALNALRTPFALGPGLICSVVDPLRLVVGDIYFIYLLRHCFVCCRVSTDSCVRSCCPGQREAACLLAVLPCSPLCAPVGEVLRVTQGPPALSLLASLVHSLRIHAGCHELCGCPECVTLAACRGHVELRQRPDRVAHILRIRAGCHTLSGCPERVTQAAFGGACQDSPVLSPC